MGLDNGFLVKGIKLKDIPKFVKPTAFLENGLIEIAYWRKCWGIRNELFEAVKNFKTQSNSKINIEDIRLILIVIRHFFSKEYWEENSDSIWNFDDYFDYNLQNYMNLFWLYGYMKEHPEVECEFYDSY